jgi:hypothetical protein
MVTRRLLDRRLLVGFGLGVSLVVALVVVAGGESLGHLGRVAPVELLGALAFVVLGLSLWGLGLAVVFETLDRVVSFPLALALFVVSVALNAVTPFGQAGGNPVSAGVITRATGTEYETALAAITSANTVNRVVSVAVGLVGLAVLVARTGLPDALVTTVVSVVATVVVIAALAVLAYRVRSRLVVRATDILTPAARLVAGVLPRVEPPTRAAVARRVCGFVDAIERLVDQPRRLAVVGLLGLLGELAVAGALWVSLSAVGASAPFAAVVVVLPLARLASVAPTPGGLGSVESALAGLLMSLGGVTGSVAVGGVLLYRFVGSWLPLLVGAGLAVGLSLRGPTPS